MIMAKDSHGNYVKIEDIKQQDSFNGISPIDFKSNGDNLKNYRIYGNTVNGESVGDRTGNLFDGIVTNEILQNDGSTSSNNNWRCSDFIRSDSESITLSWESNIGYFQAKVAYYSSDKTFISLEDVGKNNTFQKSFVLPSGASVIRVAYSVAVNGNPANRENIMLNTGSTALPYEPYGYRAPVKIEGKNLLQNTATSRTVNDVTFTVNDDGSVTCNGTANKDTAYLIKKINLYEANYILTGCPKGGTRYTYSLQYTNNVNAAKVDYGEGVIFTPYDSEQYQNIAVIIFIASGYTCDNLTFYPMIRKADITDSTYEPYQPPVTTNIYLPEPIKMVGSEAEYVDYKEQKQHRVRKNLLPNTATSQTINGVTFTVNSDDSVTCNGTATILTFFKILMTINQGSYIVSGAPAGSNRGTPYSTIRLRVPSGGTDLPPFNNNDFGTGVTISSDKNSNNDYLYKIRVPQGYTCENLTFYPMIRKASIEDDTYEPYIENTDIDVTLPALPTLSGTNTLSVNTNIKPSKVWGGLNDPRDILYVKDKLGNILFSKYYEIEDEPPLTYKAKKAGALKNYRIYGNTVNGDGVGDRTANLFDGEWTQGSVSNTGNLNNENQKRIKTIVSVIPSQTYTIRTNLSIRMIFAYNDTTEESGIVSKLLDIMNGVEFATITIPDNANLIAVTLMSSDNSNITPSDVEWTMLNTGSTALPYEPYGYRVPVTVEGKNLFNNIWEQGNIRADNGQKEASNIMICSDYFPVEYDKTYSISRTISEGYNNVRGYDASKNYIGGGTTVCSVTNPFANSDTKKGIFKITNSLVAFVKFNHYSNNLNMKYMIVEGDYTNTPIPPYEPYREPVITNLYLPEQIKKVGDDAEYIDYGEQKQHRVRKNLLENTATSQTINGVTFTVNSDKSVTCNGTASKLSFFPVGIVPEISCIINGCPQNGSASSYILRISDVATGNAVCNEDGKGAAANISSPCVCAIRIASDYTCDNLTFYPMIRKADIEDNTYEPYIENTEVDVTLPALPTLSGTNTLSVETEVQPSDIYLKGKIEKKPKIYYYSQDGQTLLYTESVLKGGNGTYSTTPTKPSTAQYTYTFVGWAAQPNQTAATANILTNVQTNINVYAAFSETVRTYTVYFYNGQTLLQTVNNVLYNGTATYTGATPTSSQTGYIFSGWSPSNTNITADTSCYAQFVDEDMYESISDTWSEIIANVSNGTYSTKYHIGDTKKIDLGTEGEVIMTIVGIDTDDLADNSGKAPITWISKQLLKTDHRMNPAKQSGTSGTGALGGWEACEMRSYLINTIKPLLPSEVRNALKTVKKYSRIYNTSETAVNNVVSNDDIWIPSVYEMNFTGYETSGVTYSTAFPDNASRIKHKVGGSAVWWLRSANYTGGFRVVSGDGSSDYGGALNSRGVAVGFCLGAPTYTVTYYSQDGQTVLSTETVEEGHDCTYSTVPTKESDTDFDYTFTGWSTTINSTTATAGATENIQQNTNLYAAFSKSFKTDTISDSWEEIITNCDNGTYASKYQIGDLKTIDVGTEGPVQMQIVAIDTDLLASDNTKKAPITWISKQLLKTSKTMNDTSTNYLSDWTNCDMRTYLKNTVLPMLPSVVQNNIKEVTKYTNQRTGSTTFTTISSTEDIWLPSYREISNNTSNCETSGVQYNSIFTDNASRVKSKVGNSADYWWTRSASVGSKSSCSYSFADVGSGGIASYNGYYCTFSRGVAIGFCT